MSKAEKYDRRMKARNTDEVRYIRFKVQDWKIGQDMGFSVPGAFKLDNLHPFKPLLFLEFSKIFTFILGPISYYPREPIMEKGNFANFKTE